MYLLYPQKVFTFFIFCFFILSLGWHLLLTQTAEKEKNGSDQTEIPPGGDPHDPSKYNRVLDTDFAISRSVVERSIQLVKRWRKLSGGHILIRQGDLFLSHMIIISSHYANYSIEKKEDVDDAVLSESDNSDCEK